MAAKCNAVMNTLLCQTKADENNFLFMAQCTDMFAVYSGERNGFAKVCLSVFDNVLYLLNCKS